MRVIAGSARGRRITAPPGHQVRPTSDRARQATFNALESRGLVVDARVLDLFAGSGALGIEALSRGAAHATFVESDRNAVAAIRSNLDTLGFAGQATVIRSDSLSFLRTGTRAADLVLVDPPYAFDAWPALLDELVRLDAVVVAETPKPPADNDAWEILRSHRYGGTVITFMAPQPAQSHTAPVI